MTITDSRLDLAYRAYMHRREAGSDTSFPGPALVDLIIISRVSDKNGVSLQ